MPHEQWKENILTGTDQILVHIKGLENDYWKADSCIQATTQTPALCTGTDLAKKKGQNSAEVELRGKLQGYW